MAFKFMAVGRAQRACFEYEFRWFKASDAAYILESGYGITSPRRTSLLALIHEAMGTKNGGTESQHLPGLPGKRRAFLTAAGQIAAFQKAAGQIVWKNHLRGTKIK